MTDITELAQSLKAAAEKAGIEQWVNSRGEVNTADYEVDGGMYIDHICNCEIVGTESPRAEFIALANPANVLSLVEALEKAQQQMTESENRVRKQNRHICELFDDNTALRKRIAELESRTVTVKLASRRLPSDYVDGEFGNDDLAAIHNACRLECKVSVEKYLSAHGIVVKWEDE